MFAVIGDSFISRLESYVKRHDHPVGQFEFYGVSGMSTQRHFQEALRRMKKQEPRFVVVNVGGNDLRWNSVPERVAEDILSAVTQIVNIESVCGVKVLSIVERGAFPEFTGLNRTIFNRLRRNVNLILKQELGDNFIDVQASIRYKKHYSADLIHPDNVVGMKLLGDCVVRKFKDLL